MSSPRPGTPVTPPPPPPTAQAAPPSPPSRYSLGSNANMIRSLALILGMVAVLIAIVPRVQSISQPAVDAAAVVSDAVRQTGLPFEAPVNLPAGWVATNARYAASTDGLPTWQGGWTTPRGGYVAIRQTQTASPAWLKAATSDGTPKGRVDVAGRTWVTYEDPAHQRTSLVNVPSGSDAATTVATVVTATADTDEVTAFVTALKPAQPR